MQISPPNPWTSLTLISTLCAKKSPTFPPPPFLTAPTFSSSLDLSPLKRNVHPPTTLSDLEPIPDLSRPMRQRSQPYSSLLSQKNQGRLSPTTANVFPAPKSPTSPTFSSPSSHLLRHVHHANVNPPRTFSC
ncbi:hypothetical protein BKA70DRAFT_1444695 [Coprinopsis sp. MPI-PUGE-AT-0042]|nr:hypothetical protein BKA70DRAFT_1444695 [Coprinopsis sp. MPI-PUGE-AT-0042]